MRVSNSLNADILLRAIQTGQTQLLASSTAASSGQLINAPGDDPVGAAQVVRIQSALDETHSYLGNINAVYGDLQLSESTLASSASLLSSVQTAALQGTDATLSPAARQTLANQVGQLRAELISEANAHGATGYLFAGTASGTAPFQSDGTFVGNANDKVVEISPGVSATVNASGANAFTAAGGEDVFTMLSDLQTALESNNPANVSAMLPNIQTAYEQMVAAQTDAGTKMDRLQTAQSVMSSTQTTLQTDRSSVLQVNPATAYTELSQTQNSLTEAVSVAKTVLDTLRQTLNA